MAEDAGAEEAVVREKERRTKGDSSWSTERARRALFARRWVGKGMHIVLWWGLAVVCFELGAEFREGGRDYSS